MGRAHPLSTRTKWGKRGLEVSDIAYLIAINWPFLALAVLIGIATGWYGAPEDRH